MPASPLYKFGPFLLDARERLLTRAGEPVPLTPKVFHTLLVLVESGGRVVDKETIIEAVWPDTVVEESNLTQNIFVLRRALGADEDGRQYIRTVSRRGYVFEGRVESARDVLPWPRRLTFRRGSVQAARYTNGVQSVVYSAAWEGGPEEVYAATAEGAESRPLELSGAGLLAASPSGDLLVARGRRFLRGYVKTGTLAVVTASGGAPRDRVGDVQWADWAPDARGFCVVRDEGGRNRLEFPVGTVVYETGGWISHPRFSPAGDLIAFLDHPVQNDDGGSVSVVRPGGKKETLSNGWVSLQGLAWSPAGDEVWFTAARAGNARALRGVKLDGRQRLIERGIGGMTLHDISRDGRVLLTRDHERIGVNCLAPGERDERDLSWFDWSLARDLSPDGKLLLFTEAGEAGGADYGVFLRRTDGSPAVRLGDGSAMALSPDLRWALARAATDPPTLALLPTGVGEPRQLELCGVLYQQWAAWFPEGRRILFAGGEPGRGSRLYVQDLGGGRPRTITPDAEGVRLSTPHALSPDGRLVVAVAPDGRHVFYPVAGGRARPVPGLARGDTVVRWTADGGALFTFRRDEVPARIHRLDLRTGAKRLWKRTRLADAAGVHHLLRLLTTPDGANYAYSYTRDLSDLYQIEGLAEPS
jgi:DNA-binding winged helix-turn-helix (wHTH) protein